MRIADFPQLSIAEHTASKVLKELIWSALGYTIDNSLLQPLYANGTHPLNQMDNPALLRFVWRFAQLIATRDPENPIYSSDLAPEVKVPSNPWMADVIPSHKALCGVSQLLIDWPSSWHMTLERLVTIEGIGINQYRLLPILIREFAGPSWAWLHESWAQFVRENMTAKPALQAWLPFYRKHTLKAGEIDTLEQHAAAKYLGVKYQTLQSLIEQGTLEATADPRTQRRGRGTKSGIRLITRDSIERLKKARDACLTSEQVGELLGISKSQVHVLVHSGWLPHEKIMSTHRRVFSLEAITSVWESITVGMSVRPFPTDNTAIKFDQAFIRLKNNGVTLPQLLKSLMQGDIECFRADESMTLRTLWFYRSEINRFNNCEKLPDGRVLLTKIEVYKRLRCSKKTLDIWCKAGLLVPILDKTSRNRDSVRFDEQEVEAFSSKYINTPEAATLLGIDRQVVTAWVRKGWLTPVYSADHLGYYLFDRAVIEERQDDQITSEQASEILGVPLGKVQKWGKLGFLQRIGTHMYSRQDILEWRSNRVSTKEVAELLGVSVTTIVRWVRAGKLTPIATTAKNDTWWWFSKSDIEKWKEDRIPTEDAMEMLHISSRTLWKLRKAGKLVPMDDFSEGRVWYHRADIEALQILAADTSPRVWLKKLL